MRRLALLVAGALALAAPASAFEPEGTWYVLVHYQDTQSAKPDAWRWEDRVWRFERQGERLEWTEWAIVIFDDETGRFEPGSGGRPARVVAAWEPSPGQLADIANGLQVNSRGSKTKTLRAQGAGAWSSSESASAESASILTYTEHWSIEGLPDRPVFAREDSLGGGGAESVEGRVEYRTEETRAGGDELVGSFGRDGTRAGRFRMIRSGGTEGVRTAARTQEELQRKAAIRVMTSSGEMAELVRARIEESLADAGIALDAKELDALAAEATQALARGESPDEIGPRLARSAGADFYGFAKPGAKPDASARYAFPFDPSTPRKLGQGVGGDLGIDVLGGVHTASSTHAGRRKWAFDFEMPVGTPVVAARAGTVVRVVDGFDRGGPQKSLAARANGVVVQHPDGTFAQYLHLSPGVEVKPGQAVRAGDRLATSGNTGYTSGPHLHFEVSILAEDGRIESVPIRFDDGSAAGVVPVAGQYYGGGSRASTPEPRAGDAP